MNWITNVSSVYLTEIAGVKRPKILLVTMPGMWDMTPTDLAPLRIHADVDVVETKHITETQLAQKCAGYDWLMLNMDPLPFPDPNRMEKLTSVFYNHPGIMGLKGINVDMTDADFFSPQLARAKGILIQDSPNTTTESVAESALTEILLHVRGRHAAYTGGETCRKNTDLKGKIGGVIGYGHIGSRVADFMRALGMNVLVYDIKKTVNTPVTPIEKIFKTADVISIHIPAHLPAQDQTKQHTSNVGFIGKNLLELCKGTVLINLATDIIVEQSGLEYALQHKCITGYSVEPGRDITKRLEKYPEVHISPCSYDSTESRQNIKRVWINNMLTAIHGTPQNAWN